jgi:hypothetical protein
VNTMTVVAFMTSKAAKCISPPVLQER